MPNFGSPLRQEIARIARKEAKALVTPVKTGIWGQRRSQSLENRTLPRLPDRSPTRDLPEIRSGPRMDHRF